MKKLLVIILILFVAHVYASKKEGIALKIDSLQLFINSSQYQDTIIGDTYIQLSKQLKSNGEPENSLEALKKARKVYHDLNEIEKELNVELQIANLIGFQLKDWTTAYRKYEWLSKKAKKYRFKTIVAECYFYMAYANWLYLGNLDHAIDYGLKSVEIYKETGDSRQLARTFNLIGLVYEVMNEYDQTIVYYNQAIAIHDSTKNDDLKAQMLYNISLIHAKQKEFDKASAELKEAYHLYEKVGHASAIPMVLTGLGDLKIQQGEYEIALKTFNQALQLNSGLDNWTLAGIYTSMAEAYFQLKQYNKAIDFGHKGLHHSVDGKLISLESKTHNILARAYAKTANYKKAYDHHIRFFEINDSIAGKEKADKIAEIENQFENKQKELQIENLEKEKKLQSVELAVSNEQKEKQTIISWAIGFGLFLLLIMTLFILNRLRVTKKQKITIEEKNQEITDSINYAKRIQTAILPPDKQIKEHLPQSFVMYLPKDIVAGDFYWVEVKDNKVLFAAADCTGHGVPGAMVSVVCNNALNRSVREYELTDPGQLLDKTREIVVQEFEKSEEEVKDGMDIALCRLDGMKLSYAGAHNPLWIIRNGELIETKANKQPIGQFDNLEPYKTHAFELQKGDTFYIFSDGYVDQFGGEQGKKYKSANFKKLLLSIQSETMDKQYEIIKDVFDKWKGNLYQLDDVCVIGVRV